MKIDILGHNNFALALIFDIIRESKLDVLEIRIVPNLDSSQNKFNNIKFAKDTDQYSLIHIDNWFYDPKKKYIIGATAGKTQRTIYNIFSQKANFQNSDFLNLFHPKSYISSSAQIGFGVIVEPNASISAFAELEDHIWIKRNVTIGHHTKIGKFTNINPGANVAGNTKIGQNCLIGVGAIVNDGISIGDNCVIGSGSVVTGDIPDNTLAYGVPAKFVKKI